MKKDDGQSSLKHKRFRKGHVLCGGGVSDICEGIQGGFSQKPLTSFTRDWAGRDNWWRWAIAVIYRIVLWAVTARARKLYIEWGQK